MSKENDDYLPLPDGKKSIVYRGISFSRSTLLRLEKNGQFVIHRLKSGPFKPRLFYTNRDLDDYIKNNISVK